MISTLVLRVDGTNCANETVIALKKAGSNVKLAHINELLSKSIFLEDYQALIIPGGFSFGDHISAGKIISNYLKIKLKKDIIKFIEENKPVIGICNGFQAILKAGFFNIEATLSLNSSGIFVDKWVEIKKHHDSVFTDGYNSLFIPINHAEGRFITDNSVLKHLENDQRILFKYVDNPNGSCDNIAGISNEQGNVIGLMPHPEKFIHYYQHPYWTRLEKDILTNEGDGLRFFKNMVKVCEKL